jgi:hypothetical protein
MPGGILSLSAPRGSTAGGIVWAAVPAFGDANAGLVPGQLLAFDASTMVNVWSSEMELGTLMKFAPPTVANGRVYVGTFDGHVVVFGTDCIAPVCPRRCGETGDNCGHSFRCGPPCPPPPPGSICTPPKVMCTQCDGGQTYCATRCFQCGPKPATTLRRKNL